MKVKIFEHEVFIDTSFLLSPEGEEELKKQLEEYLQGKRKGFNVTLDHSKIDDELALFLESLLKVEYGSTVTYGQLGKMLGMHPRKVGMLCARNPLPIVVPCHRVVGVRGIGGYSYGVELKKKLLELEKKFI